MIDLPKGEEAATAPREAAAKSDTSSGMRPPTEDSPASPEGGSGLRPSSEGDAGSDSAGGGWAGAQQADGSPPASDAALYTYMHLSQPHLRIAATVGLLIVGSTLVIYVAKPILLPIVFALMLLFIIKPMHEFLMRCRLGEASAAAILLAGLVGAIIYGVTTLSTPAIQWFGELPRRANEIQGRLSEVMKPMERMTAVAEQIDRLTSVGESRNEDLATTSTGELAARASGTSLTTGTAASPLLAPSPPETTVFSTTGEPQPAPTPEATATPAPTPAPSARERPVRVEVQEEKLSDIVIKGAQQFGINLFVTLILLFFMLTYGGTLIAKLPRTSRALMMAREVGNNISAYLFTITMINLGLGAAIALAMALLGMPNALLWGVMGFAMNYIPYIGALAGVAIMLMAALFTFDSPVMITLVPLSYFLLTSLEGNFITPMILGQRFTLNPIFIFIWLLIWGWLWGIGGMLIAVPMLMAFKIICDHVVTLAPLAELISLEKKPGLRGRGP